MTSTDARAASARARRRPHRAWAVAGVTFAALVCAAAFRSATGVLMEPVEAEFGWTRTTTSAAVTLNLVLFGLTAPFAAALMERFGLRRVVACALTLVAAGTGLTVFMTAPWQLILLWGLAVGLGTGSMALVFGAVVANRWFVSRRGLVMGVFSAASATGQLAFLPPRGPGGGEQRVAHGFPRDRRCVPAPGPGGVALARRLACGCRGSALWRPPAAGAGRAAGAGGGQRGEERVQGGVGRSRPCAVARPRRGPVAARRLPVVDVLGAGRHLLHLRLVDQRAHPDPLRPGCARPRDAHHDGRGPACARRSLRHRRHRGVRLAHRRVDPRYLLVAYYGFRGLSLLVVPAVLGPTVAPPLFLFVVFYGLDWVATVPPTVALCRNHFGLERSGVVFGWVFAAHMVGAGVAASYAGVIRQV